MKSKSTLRSFLIITASTLLSVSYTHAAIFTWDPANTGNGATIDPGNGAWNTTAGNIVWNDAGTNKIWATGNEAVFSGPGGPFTVTVTAVTAQKITFSSSANYTLSGAFNVTITPASGNPLLQVDSGAVATIGAGTNIVVANSSNLGQATGSTAAGTLNIDGTGAVIRPSTNAPGWGLSGSGFIVNVKNGTLRTSTTATSPSITVGAAAGSSVDLNVSAGVSPAAGVVSVSGTGGLVVGGNGQGTVTQTGGTITIGATSAVGLTLGNAASVINNTFNLDGGTLTTPLVKKGDGTGSNVFNFNGGLLVANNSTANATFMEGLGASNVETGGARIQNANGITINQNLLNAGGAGGLTKTGAGILTLGGANTYTGDTAVNVGTLRLSTAGTSVSNVLVATGASAGAFVAATDGQHVNTGNLTLSNTSNLSFDFGTVNPSTTTSPLRVANFTVGTGHNVLLEGAELVNVTLGQSYKLITWTGTGPANASAFSNAILSNGFIGSLSVDVPTKTLSVTFSEPPPISWNTGNGSWNTTPANTVWLNQANAATAYTNFIPVLFGDAVGVTGNPIVTLNDPLTPLGVTLTSADHNYTITGSGGIGGSLGLTLGGSNSRTHTLATANTYTGPTAVNGGTLRLGSGGAVGSLSPASAISVASGTTFEVNQSDTVTQGTDLGVISGDGGFIQSGSGSTSLNLVNTFTGPISITDGDLQVGAAGRLGGGAYGSDITVAAGSNFSYTSSAAQTISGTITGDGSLAKSGSSVLTLEIDNTYGGTTTVSAGTLRLASFAAIPSASAISLAGGILQPSVVDGSDSFPIDNQITLVGAGTTSQINAPFTQSLGGTVETTIVNQPITGAGNLRLFGGAAMENTNGTILLNAKSEYTGSTVFDTPGTGLHSSGHNLIVKLGTENALPITTILTLDGKEGRGTGRTVAFDLNGFNQTLAGLTNIISTYPQRNQVVRNTGATLAILTVNNSADISYGGQGIAGTFGGNPVAPGTAKIVGNIALTKTGTGKFTLLGSHEYSGDTTVTQGTLTQKTPNTFNNPSTVSIASAAFLELDFDETGGPVTDTVDKLFIGGVQQPAGVYKANDNVTDSGTANPRILGPGTLTVTSGSALSGYAAWAATNAGGQGSQLDFDNDGVRNGVEYFMNAPAGFTANPQLSATTPRTITWPNGGNIPSSAYGTQFVVQTSNNLVIWTNVPVGDLTANTGSLTYTLTGTPARFVRLSVNPN